MGKRKKAPSGTWVPRQMAMSKAYWALPGTAKGMLLLFLLKRDMSSNHEVLNRNSIHLTYKELENLHGEDAFGRPQGLSRSSIARGIGDLLANGFIKIIRQGGAYQKDKTVYGLSDDWKHWSKGVVFEKRPKGKKASRPTHEKNFNPQSETHTHPHSETLSEAFRVLQ